MGDIDPSLRDGSLTLVVEAEVLVVDAKVVDGAIGAVGDDGAVSLLAPKVVVAVVGFAAAVESARPDKVIKSLLTAAEMANRSKRRKRASNTWVSLK